MLNIDPRNTVSRSGTRPRRASSGRAMALVRCLGICIVPLLLGACVGGIHLSFLDAQGPVAAEQRWHFYWVLAIMAVLVAGPIFLALPLFLWRYRFGNKTSGYTPKWNYSRLLEIACTIPDNDQLIGRLPQSARSGQMISPSNFSKTAAQSKQRPRGDARVRRRSSQRGFGSFVRLEYSPMSTEPTVDIAAMGLGGVLAKHLTARQARNAA